MIGLRTIEGSSQEEAVHLQARELRRIGSEMHEEVRRLARGLRPAVLDDLGLGPLCSNAMWLISRPCIRSRLSSNAIAKKGIKFPGDVQTAVYRIVQEAATNAVRHGKSQHVQVKLNCSPAELTIAICDDGVGFNVSSVRLGQDNCPFGLLSIHERASLLGGEAAITSRPGQGTQVKASFPLQRRMA